MTVGAAPRRGVVSIAHPRPHTYTQSSLTYLQTTPTSHEYITSTHARVIQSVHATLLLVKCSYSIDGASEVHTILS